MATDEAARHELYDEPTAAIGPRPTETLMGYLPPVGWADVARRQDLELLRLEVRTEIAGVRTEMAGLRTEMADRFRQQTLALVATMVTLAGVVGAAAALV